MEETKNGLNRRDFLTTSTTAVGALGLAMSAGSLLMPSEAQAGYDPLTFPRPTVDLDVERIRDLGYYWYKKGPGCGHGAGRGLMQGISEACTASSIDPAGWDKVPRNLYSWCNGGGPNGWGVLCGTLAAAIGVITLMGLQATLASPMFEWYVKTKFPSNNFDDFSSSFDGGSGTLAASMMPIPSAQHKAEVVPDSPLCHISASKWVRAAGVTYGMTDSQGRDYRADRCGKVTGDTAAYAAQLINAFRVGGAGAIAAWQKPPAMAACFDCHDSTADTTYKFASTKMDCLPCHTEPASGRHVLGR